MALEPLTLALEPLAHAPAGGASLSGLIAEDPTEGRQDPTEDPTEGGSSLSGALIAAGDASLSKAWAPGYEAQRWAS